MGDNQSEAPGREEIALCAYLIYERGDRLPGHALEHWYEAEAQLLAMKAHEEATRGPTKPAGNAPPAREAEGKPNRGERSRPVPAGHAGP